VRTQQFEIKEDSPSPILPLLESEAIHILRETAAGFEKPVLLYSIGKDSTVLLHLARKAFHPGQEHYILSIRSLIPQSALASILFPLTPDFIL
jgi:3'-phosphoadenosine 5'-phosphosulfate sulfotransferase (PAPS reductase)/FAD synthetase